eukprot:gene32137-16662_t
MTDPHVFQAYQVHHVTQVYHESPVSLVYHPEFISCTVVAVEAVNQSPSKAIMLPPAPPEDDGGDSGFPIWAIVLIALLSLLMCCCCWIFGILCWRRRKKEHWIKEKNILYEGDDANDEIVKNSDHTSYGGPGEVSSAAAAAASALSLTALQKDEGLEDQRVTKSFGWTSMPTPRDNTDGDPALEETMLSSIGTDTAFPLPPTGIQGDELRPNAVESTEIVSRWSGSGRSSAMPVSTISTQGLHDPNLSDVEEDGTSTPSHSIQHGRRLYKTLEDLPLDSDIRYSSLLVHGGSSKDLKARARSISQLIPEFRQSSASSSQQHLNNGSTGSLHISKSQEGAVDVGNVSEFPTIVAEPQRLTRMQPSAFSSIDALNHAIQVAPAFVSVSGSSRRSSIRSRQTSIQSSPRRTSTESRPNTEPKSIMEADLDRPVRKTANWATIDEPPKSPMETSVPDKEVKESRVGWESPQEGGTKKTLFKSDSKKFIRPQNMADLEDPSEVEIVNAESRSPVFKGHG